MRVRYLWLKFLSNICIIFESTIKYDRLKYSKQLNINSVNAQMAIFITTSQIFINNEMLLRCYEIRIRKIMRCNERYFPNLYKKLIESRLLK